MSTIPGTTITPVMWFDASTITGKTDGQTVSPWSDSSGNGHNATNGNDAARAKYYTNQQNALPALRFDGSNDGYGITTPPTFAVPAYFYIVTKPQITSAANRQIFLPVTAGSDTPPGLRINNSSSANKPQIRHNGTTLLTFSTALTTWKIIRYRIEASECGILTADLDTISTEETSTYGKSIGGTYSQLSPPATEPLASNIGELITIFASITTEENASILAYLRAKWFNWSPPTPPPPIEPTQPRAPHPWKPGKRLPFQRRDRWPRIPPRP